jgi:urease gamma subunit
MRLLPREHDKLLIHQASSSSSSRHVLQRALQVGSLAQKRLARGLKLNRTEAVALIACQLHERIRDGLHSVAELMQHGKNILGRRHVLSGVVSAIHDIQVEGTFPDGYAAYALLGILLLTSHKVSFLSLCTTRYVRMMVIFPTPCTVLSCRCPRMIFSRSKIHPHTHARQLQGLSSSVRNP